jgi:CheY-like chemotaxis protein
VDLAPMTQEHRDRRQHALLVVDDSAIQRNYLTSLLSQAGYVVDTAENGFEGLKRLRTRSYSACCVDIFMPLMDGFEFVTRLRGLPDQQETPVFFITGHTGAAERERSAQLGVLQHFEKPVDPALLIQTLDRACLTDRQAADDRRLGALAISD